VRRSNDYIEGCKHDRKQHFSLLYDRARRKAINSRNIISGWSKTGLRPFNPERVLKEIQKPEEVRVVNNEGDATFHFLETPETPTAPKTFENLASLRKNVEMSHRRQEVLDTHTKQSILLRGEAMWKHRLELIILIEGEML
jgi:hypothetical protein